MVADMPGRWSWPHMPYGMLTSGKTLTGVRLSERCGWEVIYPVLGPIPNGAGTMVLRVVFLFLALAAESSRASTELVPEMLGIIP